MDWKNNGKHGLTFSLKEMNFDDCNIDFVPISLDQPSETPSVPEELDNDEWITANFESSENLSTHLNDNVIHDSLPISNETNEEIKINPFQNSLHNFKINLTKLSGDVEKHWFYCAVVNGLAEWKPFTITDSYSIEIKYQELIQNYDPNETIHADYIVPVDGGRYDVLLLNRQKVSVYWHEPPMEIRRASWFYRPEDGYNYLPYSESECEVLEAKYQEVVNNNLWNQSFELHKKPEGCLEDRFIFHSSNTIVQYRRYHDIGSNLNEDVVKGRVVCRGVNSFKHLLEISESNNIDHVIFVIHGIGPYYDLRGSGIVECVKKMRSVSKQMHTDHFSNHNGRIEILPVSWHDVLHNQNTPIDNDLSKVTLKSVPKLRNFTNNTLVDVLCYSSPKYASMLLSNVAKELNRLRDLFITRNPAFKGAFSIAGHSLGSVLAFDLICLQSEATKCLVHILDSSDIPKFDFEVGFMFALGSPISLFLTSRGYSNLGTEFKLHCKGFYNIFHPFDPVAYRIEPMIEENLSIRPVIIPHHKGRKRLHLELKDNLMRVGSDIKSKLMQTLKTTWDSLQEFAHSHKSDQQSTESEWEMLKTLQQMDSSLGVGTKELDMVTDESLERELKVRIGLLNNSKRIDYVLQESPVESFNDYLFALGSHACYWESEDTVLLIMKEIYGSLNIRPSVKKPVDHNQHLEPPKLQSHMPPPLSLSKVHSLPVIKSYDDNLPLQQTNTSIFPPGQSIGIGKMNNFFMPSKNDSSQLPSQNTNKIPPLPFPPKNPTICTLTNSKLAQTNTNNPTSLIPSSGDSPLSQKPLPPTNLGSILKTEVSVTEDSFAEISLKSPTLSSTDINQAESLDLIPVYPNKSVEIKETFTEIADDHLLSHQDSVKAKQESNILPPKMPFQTPINPLQNYSDLQRYVADKNMINSIHTPSHISNGLNNMHSMGTSINPSKPFFNPNSNQINQNTSPEMIPSVQGDAKPIQNTLPPMPPKISSLDCSTSNIPSFPTSKPLLADRYAFDAHLLHATNKISSAPLDILNTTTKTPSTFFSPNLKQTDAINESFLPPSSVIQTVPSNLQNTENTDNQLSHSVMPPSKSVEDKPILQATPELNSLSNVTMSSTNFCENNSVINTADNNDQSSSIAKYSLTTPMFDSENLPHGDIKNLITSNVTEKEVCQKSSNFELPPSNLQTTSSWSNLGNTNAHYVPLNDNFPSQNASYLQPISSSYSDNPPKSNTCLPPSNLQNFTQMNYFTPATVCNAQDNISKPNLPYFTQEAPSFTDTLNQSTPQYTSHSQMFPPNVTSNYFNPTHTTTGSYFTPNINSYNATSNEMTNFYPNFPVNANIPQNTFPSDVSYFQPNQPNSSDIKTLSTTESNTTGMQVNQSHDSLAGYFSNSGASDIFSEQSQQQSSTYTPPPLAPQPTASLSLTPRPPSSIRTTSPNCQSLPQQPFNQFRNASVSPSPSSFSSSSRNQSKRSPTQVPGSRLTPNNLGNFLGAAKPLVPQSGKVSRKNKSGK